MEGVACGVRSCIQQSAVRTRQTRHRFSGDVWIFLAIPRSFHVVPFLHYQEKAQSDIIMKYEISKEQIITLNLPYHDRRIVTMATVKVNHRVWQKLAHLDWRVLCGRNGTQGCYVIAGPTEHPTYLHRRVMQYYGGEHCLKGGLEVDHMDLKMGPLNNTIQSLRICTRSQNCQSRGPSNNGKVSHKGVWQRPMRNKKRGDFYGYVTEYHPPNSAYKITKSWPSPHLAALFYNMLSRHYSPEFNYQNRVLEDITGDEKCQLDAAFRKCIEKHTSKTTTQKEPAVSEQPTTKRAKVEL